MDCRDPRFPRCARQRGKHHSNRFVLPYTSGAVCNKSSVAAMLGVMDNVAPFQGENEFPDDVPFDTYFGEQKRRAEEMARAAAEYAAAQQQNDYGNTIEYEELPTPRTSSVSRLLPTLRPSPNRASFRRADRGL